MALFGLTAEKDSHQQGAVFSALDMIDSLKKFNEKRAVAAKAHLRIGSGIASGMVIAGYEGTYQHATYTCAGETVNLAARLETYARETTRAIVFEAEIRANLSAFVQAESLEEVNLKGKTIPTWVNSVKILGNDNLTFSSPGRL